MTASTTNVFPDAQASLAVVLRPPDGFQALYQGVARTTPLAFVEADASDRYLSLDARAGQTEMSEFLLRYVPTPIGATMMLYIPRALYLTDTPQETLYTYELRWRLRTVLDHNALQRGAQLFPYTMPGLRGAYEDTPSVQRILIPGFTSEVVSPAVVGSGLLPIVSGGAADPQVGYATQGLYVPATVGGETIGHAPNAYFNPLLRRVIGNELSVVAYRASGASTWDFAGADAGISNVYGTNQGGAAHPEFKNVGMLLVFVGGSPAL